MPRHRAYRRECSVFPRIDPVTRIAAGIGSERSPWELKEQPPEPQRPRGASIGAYLPPVACPLTQERRAVSIQFWRSTRDKPYARALVPADSNEPGMLGR